MTSKTHIFCIIAVALVALCCSTSAEAKKPKAVDAGGGESFRVMSFNILRGDLMGPDHLWELRKDACLEMLSVRKPDILGTVECTSVQRDDILAANPRYEAIGVSVKGDSTDFPKTSGNLIYYDKEKFELEEWGTLWLSSTPDVVSNTFFYNKPRTATWARLKLKNQDTHLVYICVHLQDNSSGRMKPYGDNRAYYGPECRNKEMAVLLSRLPEINPDGCPMLLGGDLNCKSEAEELYGLFDHLDLVAPNSAEADLGNTFNGFKSEEGTSRIDHLFSSKCRHSLFAVDRETYAGTTYISDHFPIYTDFTIK